MAITQNESNSQQQPEGETTYNKEQYERLKHCSDKKDMTEWNKWREEHQCTEIFLEGAELDEVHLEGVNLTRAHLKEAYLKEANLKDADLSDSYLEHAYLFEASLENANLRGAYLVRADLTFADLKDANLINANLEGANLFTTRLVGAMFQTAILNGATLIWCCPVDHHTDFRGVGLDSTRIDTGTKQVLKYNNRRMNWKGWYKKHWFWRWPVCLFWVVSDYGRSTGRVVLTFFILALLFALVYYFVPSLVEDLHGTAHWYSDLVRACYFSVVTMTTLGFGDMFANKQSMTGHILLMFQVLLGYVLLAALVTRFAVLFTAGGPAGTFSKREPKEKAKSEKDKKPKDEQKE